MNVSQLRVEYKADGGVNVSCWVDLRSQADCDVLIAWLKMAKTNMTQWQTITAPLRKQKDSTDA